KQPCQEADYRVYLVTEGCGFTGEKIVELLSQQDYRKEVRGFGSVAREEVEKFITGKKRASASIKQLQSAPCCHAGAHVVVHTVAVVDYRNTVPFWEMRAVNVGVSSLKQSSALLHGHSSCLTIYFRGNEDTKYSGEVELPYGKTKAMAEKLVFEANGKQVQDNGGKLATCIIRANTMYGKKATFLQELYLLTKLLLNTCFSPPLISPGNVASMHVLAARNLQLKPDLLAGQVYYAYADTPTTKSFLIRHQLLSSMDPSVGLGSHILYWKIWLMIQVHTIIKVILYPFQKPQPFLPLPLLNTTVTTFSYETDKASRHFGYKPLFTWEESKHSS
uniref:3-beta hydroxysteroid dehydrogenase/isomerase domain-containing protein n=1 Tax=Melopsittacus undulatus TaxID=13146 RepID=A0A8V5GIB9_MELUD